MTRNDSKKLMAVITAAYRNFYKDISTIELEAQYDLWASIFADYEYSSVDNALMSYIATDKQGYPPVPGKIMDMMYKLNEIVNNDKYPNEIDAWSMVYKAISNSTYNSAQEFDKLPEIIKKTINSPAYLRELALTEDFNSGVESSNFKKVYRATIDREKEVAKIPKQVLEIQQQALKSIEKKEEGK